MCFLKNIFSGGPKKPEKKYYVFQVKCKRCGEIIEGRVDLDNDLSLEYEDSNNVYFGRKVPDGQQSVFSADRSGNEVHARASVDRKGSQGRNVRGLDD